MKALFVAGPFVDSAFYSVIEESFKRVSAGGDRHCYFSFNTTKLIYNYKKISDNFL